LKSKKAPPKCKHEFKWRLCENCGRDYKAYAAGMGKYYGDCNHCRIRYDKKGTPRRILDHEA
jgi:hypothetical protein